MKTETLAELWNILANLYPDEPSIHRIVAESGFDVSRVVLNSTATNNWHSVLIEAEKLGRVNTLLSVVEREYGSNKEFRLACDIYRRSTIQVNRHDYHALSSLVTHTRKEGSFSVGVMLSRIRLLFFQGFQIGRRFQLWIQVWLLVIALICIYNLTTQFTLATWTLVIVVFLSILVGVIFALFPLVSTDIYHSKFSVNWVWAEMLRSAEESIEIVAGDLSWIRDERRLDRVLAEQRSKGLPIQIICKPPEKYPLRRENIAVLLAIDIQVRTLPNVLRPTPYSGIIIDRNNPGECATFRIHTMKKKGAMLDHYSGKSQPELTNYWGKRDLANRDDEQMKFWLALAHSYWNCSYPAIIFETLPDDVSTKMLIMAALRKVAAYRAIEDDDVKMCTVNTRDLLAWCLREDKLTHVSPLMQQMQEQGVTLFHPCVLWSNYKTTVLIPPIVEEHECGLTVLDGTHRLWCLHRVNPNASAQVILLKRPSELPGEPEMFTRLPMFHSRLNRQVDIRSYNPTHWRSFTPMEEFLQVEGRRRLEEFYQSFSSLH